MMMVMILMMIVMMEVVVVAIVVSRVAVVMMMMIGSEADLQVTEGTRAYRPLIQRSGVQLPLHLKGLQCSSYLDTANMWYMESYGNL